MATGSVGPAPATVTSEDLWAGTELDIYRSNLSSVFREIRRILGPYDLLVSDFKALHHAADGPIRPTSLATKLDVTPAAATQLVDRLEQRGLLRRFPDPGDRRATVVRLTSDGAQTYDRVAREVRAMLVEITSAMSPDGLEALRKGSEELRRILAVRAAR
jgi:DNA-binding MarR family transcriptional regulator